MFNGCYSLKFLDVSNFNTSLVTSMANMFQSCYTLASLDISSFSFVKITSNSGTQSMFTGIGLHGSITLPSNFKFIGSTCFNSARSLYEFHFLSTTPPSMASTNVFYQMSEYGGKKIYVPVGCSNAYKAASNWSSFSSYIFEEGS